MYMYDVEDISKLKDAIVEQLKIKGVRCRPPKKIKDDKDVPYSEHQTFKKPLHLLQKCYVSRLNGTTVEIPDFLADVCSIIENGIFTEGIFRKAGSTSKQRESKIEVNSGKKLSGDYHVIDACNLVKLFFRELPQPILPYFVHEILLKCLLLSTIEKQVETLLLSCLLIPTHHIAVLGFFMEFLLKVSHHAPSNKMDVKNLAIILTPSMMPVQEQNRASSSLKITHHIKVIELLIEHAELIGVVPEQLAEAGGRGAKGKKHRRNGSITRMLSGIKKMVGTRGSSTPEWDSVSLGAQPSDRSRKRKADTEDDRDMGDLDLPHGGISSKKKREVLDLLPEKALMSTPLRCRMNSYSLPVSSGSHPVPSNVQRVRSRSPQRPSQRRLFSTRGSESFREVSERTSSMANLVRRRTEKKQKSTSKLYETQKKSLERRLSIISWGRKKTSRANLFLNRSAPDYEGEAGEVAGVQAPTITIPWTEYEDIKSRVSALEDRISLELDEAGLAQGAGADAVQDEYHKTLEESERIAAEHLAGRLDKELKIRRSLENKVMRSPSARKIGSIRRRSRELVQRSLARSDSEGSGCSLKRGRPNTLQTGLPSPRLQRPEEWRSGEDCVTAGMLAQRLLPSTTQRPSITKIQRGNVLEKAKLFNSFNLSGEAYATQQPRRHSVRLDNLRKAHDAQKSPKKIGAVRSRRGEAKENEPGPRKSQEAAVAPGTPRRQSPLREANRKTPRQVPLIKKSLGTYPKTPAGEVRSQVRPRPTPLKALIEPCGTPRRTPRRSPRFPSRPATARN